jgi:hypothetical protein
MTRTADDEALLPDRLHQGEIQVLAKCPIRAASDFSWLYTPGALCRAIQAHPDEVCWRRRKTGPFGRVPRDWHLSGGIILGAFDERNAVILACDLKDDRFLDEAAEKGHLERAVHMYSPIYRNPGWSQAWWTASGLVTQ